MDKDYQLGQGFSECTQKIRPDNQQKLLAIFSDFAGSDHEIISAFRLLFGNPLYITLFLERRPINLGQIASLTSIAKSSLSPNLATRAESFVLGYYGVTLDGKASQASSMPPSSPQTQPKERSAEQQPTSAGYASVTSEESTLFADEDPIRGAANADAPHQEPVGASSNSIKTANLKPLVFAIMAVLFGVALFKVPAVCEPFGLCEKRDNPDQKDTDKNRSGDAQKKPDSLEPTPPSETAQPQQPQLEDLALPAPAPAPQSPPQARAPAPMPQPVYTPAPQPESAPLRDEPLW